MSNRIISLSIFSLIIGGIILPISCISERVEPTVECEERITYEAQAKAVIDRTCAYAGCHDGIEEDDFKDFTAVNAYLNKTANKKTKFKNRVVINKDMPPNNVPSEDKLTAAELVILTCWIEEGFPEN